LPLGAFWCQGSSEDSHQLIMIQNDLNGDKNSLRNNWWKNLLQNFYFCGNKIWDKQFRIRYKLYFIKSRIDLDSRKLFIRGKISNHFAIWRKLSKIIDYNLIKIILEFYIDVLSSHVTIIKLQTRVIDQPNPKTKPLKYAILYSQVQKRMLK